MISALAVQAANTPPKTHARPADAKACIHFGGGQAQAVITLQPGTHTLPLEFADLHHVPFTPPLVSKKITVHVK